MAPVKWTAAEKQFVRTNCNRMTDGQIAQRLRDLTGKSFTEAGVRRVRRDGDLTKRKGRNSRLL